MPNLFSLWWKDTSCPGTPGCPGVAEPQPAASPWHSASAPSPSPAGVPGHPQMLDERPREEVKTMEMLYLPQEVSSQSDASSSQVHPRRGEAPEVLSHLLLSGPPPLQFGLQPQFIVVVVPAGACSSLSPGLDGRLDLPLLLLLFLTAFLGKKDQ